jgi:hypothetical protein
MSNVFDHATTMGRTMIQRKLLELKFKERDLRDDPEEDGSATYWKILRREEIART